MSLNEPSIVDIVFKQARYKINANATSFTVFIALQIFALLFSFSSMTGNYLHEGVSLIEVSPVPHGVFTLIWAFFVGMSIALLVGWNETFSLPSTRVTHHLSNLIFILFATFVTSLITALISPALRLLTQLKYKEVSVLTKTITEAPGDFIIQFFTSCLYIFLAFIIGYTIRSIIQSHRGLGGTFLIVIVALLLMTNGVLGIPVIEKIFFYFIRETSFFLFFIKILVTCSLLFSISIYMTNRLEVRN